MSTPPSDRQESGSEARELTHVDAQGRANMVDVTAKPLTRRVAVARCTVSTSADATKALARTRDGLDPVEGARFAGIQAAKQTSSLVPLCHPIRLDRVTVDVSVDAHEIEIAARTEIVERTGVEMEALVACAVAGLTLVDALLDVDPRASIENLTLWQKSGGRSGDWFRTGDSGELARVVDPPVT